MKKAECIYIVAVKLDGYKASDGIKLYQVPYSTNNVAVGDTVVDMDRKTGTVIAVVFCDTTDAFYKFACAISKCNDLPRLHGIKTFSAFVYDDDNAEKEGEKTDG